MGVDYRRLAPTFFTENVLWIDSAPGNLQSGLLNWLYYENFSSMPQIVATNLSLFAADSWRVNSRLTADFGLRWEYNPAPTASGPGLLRYGGRSQAIH